MYLCRENIIEGKVEGYFIDEKISGKLIESHYVTLSPKSCSCRYFAESNNKFNHFHIVLCEHWVKQGCPTSAMYAKSKTGKIITLCPGFVKRR